MPTWEEPVERVAALLRAHGADARIEQLARDTGTAAAAATAVGCDLSQIVKSLVFVCDGHPVLALVPGDRRADVAKIAAAVGAERARVATAEEVVVVTGFEPGGVAPFPLPRVSRALVDRRLLRHDVVWAGAGTPRHVVALAPPDLVRLANGELVDLAQV